MGDVEKQRTRKKIKEMRNKRRSTSLVSSVERSANNSFSMEKHVLDHSRKRKYKKTKTRKVMQAENTQRTDDIPINEKKTTGGYDDWTVVWHCDLKMKLARVGSAAEIISTAEANVRASRPVQTYVPPPVTQVVPSPVQSEGGMLRVAPSTPQETSVTSEEDLHLDTDISPQRVTPNLTRTGAPVRHSIMKRKLIDIHIA